jgi:hypothetical protein
MLSLGEGAINKRERTMEEISVETKNGEEISNETRNWNTISPEIVPWLSINRKKVSLFLQRTGSRDQYVWILSVRFKH